jgi:ATP-dependent RNA helicase DDX21
VCITFYTQKTKYLIEDIERQAGIKLKRVGVPQPEDVIRASAKDILTNLQLVNPDVLAMFKDAAKDLIETNKGDGLNAVC